MTIQASAAANIALIKYMGKTKVEQNEATNSSLSFTIDSMRTFVELHMTSQKNDSWQALENYHVDLSSKAQERFLNHLSRLKKHFKIKQNFIVKSGNNFPSDAGLASSASSFAALTMAFYKFAEQHNRKEALAHLRLAPGAGDAEVMMELSKLSRAASGSSCRSFFSPWALWKAQGAESIAVPYTDIKYLAIVVEKEKKIVSSSEAHIRVSSSKLFLGRAERAEQRLSELLASFQSKNWRESYEIVWSEFWDMHALFETSNPNFGYMKPKSMQVLNYLREFWTTHQDGPLITMDAGPNIHLLFRADQTALLAQVRKDLGDSFLLIGD